jgi:hypothetical protein
LQRCLLRADDLGLGFDGAFLQRLEGDIGRHQLGERGREPRRVGILGVEHGAVIRLEDESGASRSACRGHQDRSDEEAKTGASQHHPLFPHSIQRFLRVTLPSAVPRERRGRKTNNGSPAPRKGAKPHSHSNFDCSVARTTPKLRGPAGDTQWAPAFQPNRKIAARPRPPGRVARSSQFATAKFASPSRARIWRQAPAPALRRGGLEPHLHGRIRHGCRRKA